MAQTPKLTQRTSGTPVKQAEVVTGGEALGARDAALMQAGALLMGNARRQRDEVEDLVLIRRLHETGGYRQIVAAADAEGYPWRAFCGLIGWREKTLNERLKALDTFGPEVMGLMVKSGVPQVGIRALLAAPDELQSAFKARGKGEVTVADLETVFDQIAATQAKADNARKTADTERKARARAEKELAKKAEKLTYTLEDLWDANAKVRRLEEGRKIRNVVDVERNMEVVSRALDQMLNIIGETDVSASRVAAGKLLGKMEEIATALQEQIADIREAILG